MAQIFVSHSARDRDLVDFFSRLAARSKVRFVFEELEKLLSGAVTAGKIRADIEASNAVFLLLSHNVQAIPHTRDWVIWESGVSHNKDIWVFEPLADFGRISVVTPFLRHYVIYEPSDTHFPYISQVVSSYDDSGVLPAMAASGGLGAAFGGAGAVVGAIAGAILANPARSRPTGISTACPHCSSSYSVHLPERLKTFRCPVCNAPLQLPVRA
ncbi:MAG: hypothetical protein IT564_11650 [Rhodospirillales bacterium]|nr:hypothetical protein [Rhodospirillales bacterium]